MRTPEQGHTKKCLATAIICAIENLRDNEYMTDIEFVLAMQDNEPLAAAYEYLETGLKTCECPPFTCGTCGAPYVDGTNDRTCDH